MTYRYRKDILDRLAGHGLQPKPTTRPELLHEFVNDLYRYELRRLRDRLIRREFPKASYFARVIEIRERYSVLSLRNSDWVEPPDP